MIAQEDRISQPATLIVAAGVAAAWIAAGSSGLLAHSLQHVLTCLVLGVAVVAGWPTEAKEWKDWTIFAGGVAIAIFMAVFPLEVVNILAIVIILSTLAHFRGGLDGRAILLTATAVLCFAVCHFLLGAYPRFWTVSEHFGQALGWLTGKITGQRLTVGATFAGVDFLMLMIFLYGLWLYNTASPRTTHALYGGIAIIAAQFAYLAVLACSEKLIAALPAPIFPVEDDYMRMGAWVWQNAIRAMIPWNLPALALILQTLVAALMFRTANWRIDLPITPEKSPVAGGISNTQQVVDRKDAKLNVFYRFGPAVAALLLAALTALWMTKSDLDGKTIVIYQSAEVNWTKPEQGESSENGYGLLSDYVQSLGGKAVFSRQLSAEELAQADVVLLLDPEAKFTQPQRSRLDDYVSRGGSLLLATDNNSAEGSRKKLAVLLESSGIQVSSNKAVCRIESWEQSCQALHHPVSLGVDDSRNGFGFDSSSPLRVQAPAFPLLVGRWGLSDPGSNLQNDKKSTYRAGNRLGDLVLLAESARGNGKIVVLGDMACLSNDVLPVSYEFLGRLLGYLAQKSPAISLWRTLGVLLFAVSLLFFVVRMQKPTQLTTTALVFAAALIFCRFITLDSQRIVPGESEKSPHNLAYIDASHLEAYSDKLRHPLPTVKEFTGEIWSDPGMGNFARTLVRNGYLPIRLKELSPEQLKRGSLLVSVAPGRSYSAEETATIRKFVEDGGTLLCIVGAEESRAINPFLEEFNLWVPHSPVLPHEMVREPEPNGALSPQYTKPEDGKQDAVQFFAAWEINSLAFGSPEEQIYPQISRIENNREKWIVAYRTLGNGFIAVIADTYFAANENPDAALNAEDENERFWQWILPRITTPAGTRKNNSPVDAPANMPTEDEPIRESGPDEG